MLLPEVDFSAAKGTFAAAGGLSLPLPVQSKLFVNLFISYLFLLTKATIMQEEIQKSLGDKLNPRQQQPQPPCPSVPALFSALCSALCSTDIAVQWRVRPPNTATLAQLLQYLCKKGNTHHCVIVLKSVKST